MKTRNFYAAHSYMGLNYTYDSPCWLVCSFLSKKERDEWVKDNEYSQDTGNYVAEKINFKTACKIAHDLYRLSPEKSWRVICR